VLCEGGSVAVTEGVEEARGALDVGEDEGDGPLGQLSYPPSAAPRCSLGVCPTPNRLLTSCP